MAGAAQDRRHEFRACRHFLLELVKQTLPPLVRLGRDLVRLRAQERGDSWGAALAMAGMNQAQAAMCIDLFDDLGDLDFDRLEEDTWRGFEEQHFLAVVAWGTVLDPEAAPADREAAKQYLQGNMFEALALYTLQGDFADGSI